MAAFTNFATLSYNGGTTNSNIVTGELLEIISATKTAVMNDYSAKDDVAFVISIVNSGSTPVNGLSISDDLGVYELDETTLYPLEYTEGSVRFYVNGILQAVPAVTAGPPLVISNINIPAGGNAVLIYESAVTNYAPLGTDASITNTATITGGGLSSPVTAAETITTEQRADLTISKAVCPAVVAENGQLTYTFVIENIGNTEASAADNVILTDIFDPILGITAVTLNGTPQVSGVNYTYNQTTGEFATLSGQITVPAASYTQNDNGTWTVTPGTAVLVITGTV